MLSKLVSIHAGLVAGTVLSLAALAASPASAASALTFVSGKGTDSGTCANPAHPCFAFAFGVTNPGGEIKALDPADYGGVVVTHSVTITGVEGASINRPSGYGIYVNAGATDVVNVSNLIFDGAKATNYGLLLKSVGSLTVTNCTFRNFASDGIFMQPNTGTTLFRIADVVTSDNVNAGIHFVAAASAVTNGVIERTRAHHNGSGFYMYRISNNATLNVVVNSSSATNNQTYGFLSAAVGTVGIHNSVLTGNGYGLFVNSGSVSSTGDNFIYGNTTDTAGGFSTIALK